MSLVLKRQIHKVVKEAYHALQCFTLKAKEGILETTTLFGFVKKKVSTTSKTNFSECGMMFILAGRGAKEIGSQAEGRHHYHLPLLCVCAVWRGYRLPNQEIL